MDLEVVGRHALLFDDDAMAAFVNSSAALVDWNSLSIDRYDVRHLLSAPPPPRSRRRHHHSASPSRDDDSLESELDHERYLDLSSPNEDQDLENEEENENPSGYNAVPFSYGAASGSFEQQNTDAESSFQPSFSVPEHLLQHLPPTEKVHQIIARTAMFVSKHGGQSEIVLRVKQGDNPTFGFLLPDHNLHPYFRFLVNHKELLKPDIDGKSTEEVNKIDGGLDQIGGLGGALSLLGSVYGSGEDEEAATEDAPALTENDFVGAVNANNTTASHGSEQKNTSNVPGKDDILSRPSLPALKEKSHVIKRNRSISGVKSVSTSGIKKDGDSMGKISSTVDKLQPSVSKMSKVEQSVVEPPTDMKRVVDKIVEFILRNGKEFEAVLVQQDTKHGRFPFLLPSNQFHPYYLNILQKARESRSAGKMDKHDSLGDGMHKKTGSRENDPHLLASDIPYDTDRKEKFKMILGKSKKDGQDPPSKANLQPVGVSVDAVAAILQAARKGIKNPNLETLCKTINGSRQAPSSEGGDSQISSQALSSSNQKLDKDGDSGVSVPVGKAIAKTAAVAAASEADSSEASFTREQKLKAERLKRAKMFAAMVKSGVAPLKSESLRGLSVEPSESGFSGSDSQVVCVLGQERESSSVPLDVDSSHKTEKPEKKGSAEEHNERRLKRSYRSRSKRAEEEEQEDEEEDDDDMKQNRDHKPSRKKRHRKSHRSKDRHKHRKRHSSTQDLDSEQKLDSNSEDELRHSRHRHEHDISSDDGRRHSRHRHNRDSSLEDGHRHRRQRHRHGSSDDEPTHSQQTDDEHTHSRHRHSHRRSHDDEHRRSRHRHRHDTLSDEEHRYRAKSVKHSKTSHSERDPDLEEGEILAKSDQSKASECGDGASREASVDLTKSQPVETTEVSDDLRAKIRAMLMATL